MRRSRCRPPKVGGSFDSTDAEERRWIMDPQAMMMIDELPSSSSPPPPKPPQPASPPPYELSLTSPFVNMTESHSGISVVSASASITISEPNQPPSTNPATLAEIDGVREGVGPTEVPSSRRNRLSGMLRDGRPINAVSATPTAASSHQDDEMALREKQFLLAVERGDLGTVRRILEMARTGVGEFHTFNVNCIDPLGRNALLTAIENENIEMIEALLDANIETGDAILYAINEENVEAVEIILNHLEKLDKFNAETQGVEINEHSAFTPDITPIILAAHRDNYEIINLLLQRGASIPHPHDANCCCEDCQQANATDSLKLSRSRINAYRALGSPSLICLSSKDPIKEAFDLSWELRRLSFIENEFKTEYQELSQKCQKFSVGMLDQVRGSKELEVILNHDTSDKFPAFKERAPGERMELSRLKLAIQFRQKRFVAHPNCQQLLASIWYEGLPGFRRRNIVFKIAMILGVSVMFPVLAIIYLIAPKSRMSKFIRQPFVKFLCHSASYCFFLLLLILASQRIDYDRLMLTLFSPSGTNLTNSSSKAAERKEKRGPPPTPVEWAIMVYVWGLIWVEIKQLWNYGLHDYCHNLWNILDFITNSMYLMTIALRLVAYVQTERELADPERSYMAGLQRKYWNAFDPTLISECLFATANIFSSLKLVHIFTVNPHLGPLQISLGRMVMDIMKFFIVYCLVLFAFACGLNQLFWYYGAMRSSECAIAEQFEKDITDHAGGIMPELSFEKRALYDSYKESCSVRYRSCSSLFHTVETLFWAMFGLVDLENFALKEDHFITAWAGKTMFGTYGFISIIVLLNMLIAMMSNSYQYISNQADIEWKFARSRLWIEYFEEGTTLPAPFNIIPSPKSCWYVIRWLLDRWGCRCSHKIQQSKQRSLRLQKILKAVSQREANYQFVSRNLVKRYIAHVQRQKQQSEGVSEDDVNEIKQDISAFRYELLGILRTSGMNTGHADISQKTMSRNKKRSAQAERRLMKGMTFNVGPVPEGFLPKVIEEHEPNGGRNHHAAHAKTSAVRGALASRRSSTGFGHRITASPAFNSAFGRLKRLSKKVKFKTPATGVGNGDGSTSGSSSASASVTNFTPAAATATTQRLSPLVDDDWVARNCGDKSVLPTYRSSPTVEDRDTPSTFVPHETAVVHGQTGGESWHQQRSLSSDRDALVSTSGDEWPLCNQQLAVSGSGIEHNAEDTML